MDVWRGIVDRLHEQELEGIALEAPEQLNDTVAGLTCPHCGSLETAVQEVEDAEVELSGEPQTVRIVVCADCTAEFSPPKAGAAQLMVADVLERRERLERKAHLL